MFILAPALKWPPINCDDNLKVSEY